MLRLLKSRSFETIARTVCENCGGRLYRHIPFCTTCKHRTMAEPEPEDESIDPLDIFHHKPAATVRVAHLTDLHIGLPVPGLRTADHFWRWLRQLQLFDVDVVVVSGDLIHTPGDIRGLRLAKQMLQDCGIPWCVVPGNHDTREPGKDTLFFEYFGHYPRVERLAGLDFILFDSMRGLDLHERTTLERVAAWFVNCLTEGSIGEDQFVQAAEALSVTPADDTATRIIVLHHHVTYQYAGRIHRSIDVSDDLIGTMKALFDAHHLFSWAPKHRVSTILHGHHHSFQKPGIQRGNVLVMNGGSSTLGGERNLARLIDYTGNARVVHTVQL